ncbi:MAG TPA: dihydrolipoamide acetyltransferase family protein [Solirubrobacteraceae bacterium]|nr:dihydrolipoamide acetyltransferase family protein [Solirubrobacteraceae bacterium]
MADVAMPRLSDSMEEGTILKWLKSDGDEVSRGDELVEIETDKANMTYEADQDGTLSIVAQEGDTLAVGETIARIGEGGESNGAAPAEREASEGGDEGRGAAETATATTEAPAQPRSEEPPAEDRGRAVTEPPAGGEEAPAPAEGGNGRIKASPVARRMARELGLELGAVQGTGPGGRIVKADVEAASKGDGAQAAAPAEAPAAPAAEPEPEREERTAPPAVVSGDAETGKGQTTTQDLTRLQQTVARRMAESKATAPDFVLNIDVDMEEAVDLRKRLKAAAAEGQSVPSFNDFVVKASALALVDFPRANGAYRDGKFELYSRVNVGVAVAGQDALVVPTVFDADTKSLGQISRETRALAERVRAGAITPPELSSGTFTVSNLGMFGIQSFVAVINPPQAAILAVGATTPTPVVRDGEVVVRNIMRLTLACDHRILYGADAAEFLGRIRERLESPLQLAL